MTRLFYLLFLISQYMQSQAKIVVRDKVTFQPISYVNIWKDKTLYKTSDSIGVFDVDKKDFGTFFKITCIGYNDTIVKMSQVISLQPSAITLDEVIIVNRKFDKKQKLGKANRGDTSYGVQWDSKTAMVAKFFPNEKKEISYLSKVRFSVYTSAKNRKLCILIYTVDKNGMPNELINNENIIFNPKKGTHIAEIDLNKWNFKFPKEGVFVVIQHPLLEQNKVYAEKTTNPNAFIYEPLISVDYTEEYKDTWCFKEDKWDKNERYSVNMELQLTD
ncbi:hypothetical protein [Flavobacterium sp.]|uniref:hypothetical protein n=1 Tax=Flavobacterium sp. TaxID=239 RepID=UPI003751F258